MTFSHYCTCGAMLIGTAEPAQIARDIIDGWKRIHSGKGHGPADPATVARMYGTRKSQARKAATRHG